MHHLILSSYSFTNASVVAAEWSDSLESIEFNDFKLDDDALRRLVELPHLTGINCSGNAYRDSVRLELEKRRSDLDIPYPGHAAEEP